MLCKVKIETQYANKKEVIKEGPFKQILVYHSWPKYVANKGQNKG